MEYHFYPPFFVVSESTSFFDAWESFCRKILNLENKTHEIYKRSPPENGVDLFYKSKKIAYQCKSTQSSLDPKFNITKAVDSLKTAIKAKEEIGWEEYHLCTNIEITGKQQNTLEKVFPDIKFKPLSFWMEMCEKYPSKVRKNFRQLVKTPTRSSPIDKIDSFEKFYTEIQREKLLKDSFTILLYSDKMEKVFEFKVSKNFTGNDLIEIIRKRFSLIKPFEFDGFPVDKDTYGKIKVTVDLYTETNLLDKEKSLEENQIKGQDILCLVYGLEIDQSTFLDIKNNDGTFTTKMSFTKNITANITSVKKLLLKKAEIKIDKLLNDRE
ncbi:MAG: hypothetical protein AB8E82_06790 [Aureispira sp.]